METDKITGITLVSGTHGVRYDFYELLPVSLSGYVYEDLNDNGQRDAGEAGIAGVTLTLLDAAGQPTGTTAATDGSGFYRFDGLEAQHDLWRQRSRNRPATTTAATRRAVRAARPRIPAT